MSDDSALTHDSTIGRQQCPECQLWTDIQRLTIVEGELRCLRCADGEEADGA
jgi:hypothetical protein